MKKPIILFGAGFCGKLALEALGTMGLDVDYFCDDMPKQEHCGVTVISPDDLAKLSSNTQVFICTTYGIASITSRLKQMGFRNIHNCIELFKNITSRTAEIDRRIKLYELELTETPGLNIKHLDVVVTEKCSLKCRDCANLMQYYIKPQHSDLSLLFWSIDKIMDNIDSIYEFRVLGGEPFMCRDVGRVINKLVWYAKSIVIYTNATIIPAGKNLDALRNPKVLVQITNYGPLSKKFKQLIDVFTANNIAHTVDTPRWTDSGQIIYHFRTTDELQNIFQNCCVRDSLTLLHGKLYRCPFSAHVTNLGAILSKDFVDLSKDNIREKIKHLYTNKEYLTTCMCCNGRDYTVPEIEPAIQIKEPRSLHAVI